jgi:UDP-N-acetylglucosamine 2-epimerase (non-hydrolysing)
MFEILILNGPKKRGAYKGIEANTAKLVGTDKRRIVSEALLLLKDKNHYHKMAKSANPYGDGNSSGSIKDVILKEFSSRI